MIREQYYTDRHKKVITLFKEQFVKPFHITLIADIVLMNAYILVYYNK